MKIKLDSNNYIEVKLVDKESLSLSVRVRKDKESVVLVTTYLNSVNIDELISKLVSLRSKVKDE